jgi:hypothetical protein
MPLMMIIITFDEGLADPVIAPHVLRCLSW